MIFKFIKLGAQIIEGYFKWFLDILHITASRKASVRYAICKHCEHNVKGICSQCGCVIKAKVRVDFELDESGISVDGCPERKW